MNRTNWPKVGSQLCCILTKINFSTTSCPFCGESLIICMLIQVNCSLPSLVCSIVMSRSCNSTNNFCRMLESLAVPKCKNDEFLICDFGDGRSMEMAKAGSVWKELVIVSANSARFFTKMIKNVSSLKKPHQSSLSAHFG